MFIDELTLTIKAGKGGDGVVRFLHERGKEKGGPSGGDGGDGGNVYVVADRDVGILSKLRFQKEYEAENGEDGKKNSMHGKNGEDLDIRLPIGSVITNTITSETIELLEEGDRVLLLKGGTGGYGNEHFKGAANQVPREHTPGKLGEEGVFSVELRIIADAGFVGFPNAGKTSLLNALTRADAKVADYQFTTLDPNLGEIYGYVLADIPGLIEGASDGKGLGHKFLRHISRTRLILHCISLERDELFEAYTVIRGELESHEGLVSKEEIIVLTKSDLVSNTDLKDKVTYIKEKTGKNVLTVSVVDDESIKIFQDELVKHLRQ